ARGHWAEHPEVLSSCAAPCAKTKRPKQLSHLQAAELDACLVTCGVEGAGAFVPVLASRLEATLREQEPHPCRTELFDDLLRAEGLPALTLAGMADDVEACAAMASTARRDRQKAVIDKPDWPRRK